MALTVTIETEDLTKRILEDLSKDKVISKIYKDINGYNSFRKIDLRLLTF